MSIATAILSLAIGLPGAAAVATPPAPAGLVLAQANTYDNSNYGAAPKGYGDTPGYGTRPSGNGGGSTEYAVPPAGNGVTPPGYGAAPPGYGQSPNSSYGKAPSYGTPPPGYGAAPGYGVAPPGYGSAPSGYGVAPPGYGASPGYGAAPGYGASPGYGTVPREQPAPPRRPPEDRRTALAKLPIPPAVPGVTYRYDQTGHYLGAIETIDNTTREYDAYGHVTRVIVRDGRRIVMFDGDGRVLQHSGR